MSKLEGHKKISRAAVRKIQSACKTHSLGGNLEIAELAAYSVARDIMDVINLGHWRDSAQAHHFMRRSDGEQSGRGAYDESVEWIRSNALRASGLLSERIAFFKDRSSRMNIAAHASATKNINCRLTPTSAGTRRAAIGRQIWGEDHIDDETNDVSWQYLGNAMHCVQDSFSLSHVLRDGVGTEANPGDIVAIEVYDKNNKIDHSKHDKQWEIRGEFSDKVLFSLTGHQAINATKALIVMVKNTGISGVNGQKPTMLKGWSAYQAQWIAVSSKLT